jgi:hypothetical protein
MGKLVNLSLVLTNLPTMFALVPKLALPGQIVVETPSTAFIAVALWKTNHCLNAEYLSTGYQLQQDVCAQPLLPPFSHTEYTC